MANYDIGTATGISDNDDIADSIVEAYEEMQPMLGVYNYMAPIDVVVLGASIMQGTFGNEDNKSLFISTAASNGLNISSITEYAIGGYTTSQTLSQIPTVISNHSANADNTIVLIHSGGNDITGSGPYPGGADTLVANYTSIIDDLQEAGFSVYPMTISYRTPPASNPSASYNELGLLPLIREKCMNAVNLSGRASIDFYRYTLLHNKDNQTDGTHYTEEGYENNAVWLGKELSRIVKSNGEVSDLSNVIIDFGDRYQSNPFTSITNNDSSVSYFLQDDGSVVDLSISVTGFASSTNGSGLSYDGEGYVLSNNYITRDSFFVCDPSFTTYVSGDHGEITFSGSGIVDSDIYDVTILASRGMGDALRVGLYTINGVTQSLDGADLGNSEPNTITFTGVTGAQLKASGILIYRETELPNYFAYVNGIQITKQ